MEHNRDSASWTPQDPSGGQKSVFHKSNFGFKKNYEILEKDFEEVSIILASKIKKKNKTLRELNDINYFSQPAAEKVNNSWYMKKKK